MRKLGTKQQDVLNSLKRHSGFWFAGCGWIWENVSETKRVLDSLVKRGLVEVEYVRGIKKYSLVGGEK